MGNCQAAEISAVVIQHPSGRIERLYWPTTAAEVMKTNPGHHVALVTLFVAAAAQEAQKKQEQGKQQGQGEGDAEAKDVVRVTRVRLLKPKDILLVGQVYRLITSQEVSKALKARKLEKMMKTQSETIRKQQLVQSSAGREEGGTPNDQVEKQEERDPHKSAVAATASSSARPRHWRPRLQSISEAGS